jgi:hypothetical protein
MDWLLEHNLVLVIVVSLAIGFAIARRRLGTRRALRNTAIGLTMVGIGVGGVALRRSTAIPIDSFMAALPLIAAGAEWFTILTWSQRKRRAGRIIEDLGPHPAGRIALTVGVFALVALAGDIAAAIGSGTLRSSDIALQILLFSSAITAWFMARTRVYVTTEGILRFDKLIRWDDIESFEWSRGGTIDFLTVRLKKPHLFSRTIKLDVSVEQRPALERWLAERQRLQPAPVE